VTRRPQGRWAWTAAAGLTGLALIVSALLPGHRAGAAGTIVQVTPAHVDIGVGETGDISIGIVDAADLYSVSVVVGFNPAIAEVQDVDPLLGGIQVFPGSFPGPSEQPGTVVTNSADNAAGTVSYEFTLIPPAVPATGSGTLATIRFVGVAPGATSVLIQTGTLSDEFGDPLQVTFVDGTVSVHADPTATPTQPPATATPTPTETPTEVPTGTPTSTLTPTETVSPSPSATTTETATTTVTASATPAGTGTPTAGDTPTPAPTESAANPAGSAPAGGAPAVVVIPGEPTSTPALVLADPLPPQAPADPSTTQAVEPSAAEASVSSLPAAGDGGQGPLVPWRGLMGAGVIALAAGGSWAFYYLTRGAVPRE
jgi:hypothetical protein